MNQKVGTTILAWSLRMMIAVPMATLIGGFAGWAAGGAGGEWLEHAGVNDALFWGGRIGGLLGATLCPVYVGQKILRSERSISKTQPERRGSQPS